MRPIVIALALVLVAMPTIGAGSDVDPASGYAGWSLYFPVHMPGLELEETVAGGDDIRIEANMLDLAEHANSFFALGVRYNFRAWGRKTWFDLNGWHGGYDMGMDDLTADSDLAPPPIIRDFLDVNVDMQQRIVQGEAGMLLVENVNHFNLGLTSGLRHYDQTIKVFGEIPVWNSDCGLIGCFEALPFSEKQETSWTEFILGLTASYSWHERNILLGSFSWGHEESTRFQLINTFSFKDSWFTSLGWRRDEFVNDGVKIIESGLYFDLGKRF